MPGASAWNAERAKEIVAEHAGLESPMLPILHGLQEEFGCVSADAAPLIAAARSLTRAEVYCIVAFHHDFRREPCAPHLLQLCRAEACQSVVSEAWRQPFWPNSASAGMARPAMANRRSSRYIAL